MGGNKLLGPFFYEKEKGKKLMDGVAHLKYVFWTGGHTTYSWDIKWQKYGMGLNGFIFKKKIEIKILKQKKNPGNRIEVAC